MNYPKTDIKYLGLTIKKYRNIHNMTQKELGEKVGISASAIGMYEQGRRLPSIKTLIDISNVFLVDLLEFIDMDDYDEGGRVQDVSIDNISKNTNVYPNSNGLSLEDASTAVKLIHLPILKEIPNEFPEPIYEEYFTINKNLTNADYVFIPYDESMSNENIHTGDYTFIKYQNYVDNGDIALVIINENMFLRRIFKSGDSLILQSANDDFPPKTIILDGTYNSNFKIFGKLVGMFTNKYQ